MVTYKGAVYPWHCDQVGHMNVMWYVGKFDEATWQLFNALGLSPSYLKTADRGMAAVDQQISYRRELLAGAVVTVSSRVLDVKEKSILFTHEMVNDETGEIAAVTTIKAVHLDKKIRKSCAFEPAILEKAQGFAAPG
jgi:acyl-CoA thioester hydrolase